MPFISTYGLGVTLQTTDTPSFNNVESATADSVLEESHVFQTWLPTKGMTHPIYTTTVLTPQASNPTPEGIPFKIVVEFTPDDDMPAYMRGDIRVEALVDGIPCGLRVFREVKLRGKGFRVEFAGFRVGRTEERPLIFHKLPNHLQKDTLSTDKVKKELSNDEAFYNQERIPNPGAQWIQNAINIGEPDFEPDGNDGCRYPEKPEGVPKHVSHIEVLVSVGKKFLTLEKYFMAGASQTTAFYHPPKPWTALDPKEWRPPGKTSPGKIPRISGHLGMQIKSAGKRATLNRIQDDYEAMYDSPLAVGTKTFNASEKVSTWRPIGLAPLPKKCQQAKEVEYSARIHLVRFWVFVVPNLRIGNKESDASRSRRSSHCVVLHLPPEKLLRVSENMSAPQESLEQNFDDRNIREISPGHNPRSNPYDDVSEAVEVAMSTPQSMNPEESFTSIQESQPSIRDDDCSTDTPAHQFMPVTPMVPMTTHVLIKRKATGCEEDELGGLAAKSKTSFDTHHGPAKRNKKSHDGPLSGSPNPRDDQGEAEMGNEFITFTNESESTAKHITDFIRGSASPSC